MKYDGKTLTFTITPKTAAKLVRLTEKFPTVLSEKNLTLTITASNEAEASSWFPILANYNNNNGVE